MGLSAAVPLWIAALVALAWFLQTAGDLLIPIVLAALISVALEPVVAWLGRRRVHKDHCHSGAFSPACSTRFRTSGL
jgi:predicted PurR-regulated permease PerM